MNTSKMPDADAVGHQRAAQILGLIRHSKEYERLGDSSKKYVDCWGTFTGYPTISRWNLDQDATPLFDEALRVLCLKAAVYELTGGDEQAAELLVPSPVDEMVHAILAQFTLMTQLQLHLGVMFPHMTELERFSYERGGYTDHCYAMAGWGEQNPRYWFGAEETNRRLGILNSRYEQAGIGRDGRFHDIDFDSTPHLHLVASTAG